MPMRSHFDLRICQEARALTLDVYRATAALPPVEGFRLTDQMLRAAASVSATIAEGCGRRSKGEYPHFLAIARGSAHEMTNHLALAKDLGYLESARAEALISRYEGLSAGIHAYARTLSVS